MEYYGMPKEIVPQMLKLLSQGEGFWLTVTGYSMTPTLIHEKDRVYISPFDGKAKKGDILLTLTNGDGCLLHRVVKYDGDMLYYKGDALSCCEGPLPVRYVLGIATRVKRNGRIIKINARFNRWSIVRLRIWRLKNRVIRKFCALVKI